MICHQFHAMMSIEWLLQKANSNTQKISFALDLVFVLNSKKFVRACKLFYEVYSLTLFIYDKIFCKKCCGMHLNSLGEFLEFNTH